VRINCNERPLYLLLLARFPSGDEVLPSVRLNTGGEVAFAQVSRDDNNVFAVVKDGERYSLVAWGIAGKSKTVLARGADVADLLLSPDGRTVLGFLATKRADCFGDAEFLIWDVATKSRSATLKLKDVDLLNVPARFSADGNHLAISDGMSMQIHVWTRDAAEKWSAAIRLDVKKRPDSPEESMLETFFGPDGKHSFTVFPMVPKGSSPLAGIEKWDLGTGERCSSFRAKPVPIEGEFFGLWGPVLTDGKTLCIDTRNGGVGIAADTGRTKYILPWYTPGAVLSPNGQVGATVGWACDPTTRQPTQVSLWDFADGSHLRRVDVPFSYERPVATFSADSRCLACTGGADNRQIYVIDVAKSRIRSSFPASVAVKGLFLLKSGEFAAIGIEPSAIVVSRIKAP
jgi:WD40 repeat protein